MALSQIDIDILTAYLFENRSHRWIEKNLMHIASAGKWDGIKAKKHLWKFGLKEDFKNFLSNIATEAELETKINGHSILFKEHGVNKDLIRDIWLRSQSVYIFQRVILNENGWVRPSEGRLGYANDGEYLETNGFGHEDWNFNIELTIDDYVYGYTYRGPAAHKHKKNFNIAFATLKNGTWNIVGFYLNAKFVSDGEPYRESIIKKKTSDLLFLKNNNSIGPDWNISESKIANALKLELKNPKWKVHFKDIIVLPDAVDLSNEVELPGNNRITTHTQLSEQDFFKILKISKSTIPTFKGQLTSEEKQDREARLGQKFEDEESLSFPEGTEQYKKHKFRERNSAVVKKAKELFKKKHGRLFCEYCTFDFEEFYGKVGENFIEAHHIIPISNPEHSGATKIEEIAMLCSNCHRMLHRKRPWVTIDGLKSMKKNKL